MPESVDSVPVLLITGTGRSGSTVLGNLLGEVDGWFFAGEIRYLWERGLQEQRKCGCGKAVAQCEVWTAVLERFVARGGPADPAPVVRAMAGTQRLRNLPEALVTPDRYRRRLGAIPEWIDALYRSIREVTGAKVIVDTSKLPLYGVALDAAPVVDLSVVQLVRSPQAAAYSWMRTKALDDGAPKTKMEQRGAAKSAFLWSVWNGAAERLFSGGSYRRVRYEDVMAQPSRVLSELVTVMGDRSELPFLSGNTAVLSPNHSVAGNPDRLTDGPVTLRTDTRWEGQLRARDRNVVAAMTFPLARRYGYDWQGHVAGRM